MNPVVFRVLFFRTSVEDTHEPDGDPGGMSFTRQCKDGGQMGGNTIVERVTFPAVCLSHVCIRLT